MPGGSIGEAFITVRYRGESTAGLAAQAEREMGSAGTRAGGLFSKNWAASASKLGGTLSKTVTLPVLAGFAYAAHEADQSMKVIARTEAVIKSTGGVAGWTAKQIGDLADAISEKTAIDDEQIQSSENMLLTFKNIGGEIFARTTKATVDLAAGYAALHGTETDLSGATIQLGKAMNDPIAGLTALARVGVQFSDSQKEQIKNFVEAGDMLSAQKIILQEVESQFKGSAVAMKTPLDELKKSFRDTAENVGVKLMPTLQRLADVVGKVADAFAGLPDWAQDFLVGGLAAAAAAGPVLKLAGAFGALKSVAMATGLAGTTAEMTAAGTAATGLAAGLTAVGLTVGILALAAVGLDEAFGKGEISSNIEAIDKKVAHLANVSAPELSRSLKGVGDDLDNLTVKNGWFVGGLTDQQVAAEKAKFTHEQFAVALSQGVDQAAKYILAAREAGLATGGLERAFVDVVLRTDSATAANQRFQYSQMVMAGTVRTTSGAVTDATGRIIGYVSQFGFIPRAKTTDINVNDYASHKIAGIVGALQRLSQNWFANVYVNASGPGASWIPAAKGAMFSGGVRKMAAGGYGRPAMVARGGRGILWAEGSDESYIPWGRAQRKGATSILEQTAAAFGYGLTRGGEGGGVVVNCPITIEGVQSPEALAAAIRPLPNLIGARTRAAVIDARVG